MKKILVLILLNLSLLFVASEESVESATAAIAAKAPSAAAAIAVTVSSALAEVDSSWLDSEFVRIFKGPRFDDEISRKENQGCVLAFLCQGVPSGAVRKARRLEPYIVDGEVVADLAMQKLVSVAHLGDQVSMIASGQIKSGYRIVYSTHRKHGAQNALAAVQQLKDHGEVAMLAEAVWARVHKPEKKEVSNLRKRKHHDTQEEKFAWLDGKAS